MLTLLALLAALLGPGPILGDNSGGGPVDNAIVAQHATGSGPLSTTPTTLPDVTGGGPAGFTSPNPTDVSGGGPVTVDDVTGGGPAGHH